VETPGVLLEQLFRNTRESLLIVSPFIKVSALKRLLDNLDNGVTVDCVTRWRLEEIIAGVSDLEVWKLLSSRPNTTLSLRMNLHAKYYRGDKSCLIGSANVTNTALGWSLAPNLELLIYASENHAFEKELFLGTVKVTDALYAQYKLAVANCPKALFPFSPIILPGSTDNPSQISGSTTLPTQPIETWLPETRYPETLYIAYSGQSDKLSIANRESALADLNILSVPIGLDEKTFKLFVGTMLSQMPIVYQLDHFIESPQRFGAVRDLIRQLTGIGKTEADMAWQTLMRWLLYFLPDNYESKRPRHSEIFEKRDNQYL
jgi:hypothetical protein